MNQEEVIKHHNASKWSRKLLNVYWGLFLLSVIIQLWGVVVTNRPFMEVINQGVLYSLLFILFVVVAGELIYQYQRGLNEYVAIIISVLMMTALASSHYNTQLVLSLFSLPVIISLVYFQKRKIFFALISSLIAFYLFTWAHPQYDLSSHVDEIIYTTLLLGFITLIAIKIMNREVDFLKQLQELTEAKQELLVKNIIMDKLSKMDALTELYNHITFHEYMDHLIEQCEKYYFSLYLAIIDIDNFKQINDNFGHRAGDSVLKQVAEILRETSKPNDFIARYGGEEFAILMTERETEEAYKHIEDIRRKIADISHEVLGGNHITVSTGVSVYKPGLGKEAFFNEADQSLYEAKNSGKNRTIFHNSEVSQCSLNL